MSEEHSNIDQESQLFPQNNTGGNEGQNNEQAVDKANASPAAAAMAPAPADQGTTAQAEQKNTEAGVQAGADAAQGADPKAAAAPFDPAALRIPSGFEVDPGVLNEFAGKIKDMNLTQAQAQELVDLQVKSGQAQVTQHNQIRQAWVEELRRDPEYGGAAFEGTVQDAQAVMRRFDADGQVLEMLANSGFGDNPAVIKMLANIKRSMSEDEFVTERGGNLPEKSLNERLWPDEVMGV